MGCVVSVPFTAVLMVIGDRVSVAQLRSELGVVVAGDDAAGGFLLAG